MRGEQTLRSGWEPLSGGLGPVRLHARRGGVLAPDVVLVHGLVVSGRYMVPLARLLADRCRVHVPDLPSHGRSEDPGRALSVDERADALAGWMDVVGLRRAHFIGNSAGCQVIAALAQRHPARVDRAVLQGPTMDPAAPRFSQQFGRWLLDTRLEPRRPRRIMLQDYRQMGLHRARQTIRLTLEDRIEARLPDLHAPTLVVRGSRDPIVPQRWAEEATGLLPCGDLRVVPGAAHTMNYASPLELDRLAAGFLDLPEAA